MKPSNKQLAKRAIEAKKGSGGSGSGHIVFHDLVQNKSVSVPRAEVTFTTNKRNRPVMIAKNKGTKKDGSHYHLHRIGHV